jgi:hypothetical protein
MEHWIAFIKLNKPPDRKTNIYKIVTKDGLTQLGIISWYAPWRCYAFYPNENCVFEKTCLQDITNFIIKLMEDRKKQKATTEA